LRKTLLALTTSAVLAAGGCSSLTTNVDYDPGASFGAYKTYAFKDAFDRDGFQMKRVRVAVDKTLPAHGLAKLEKADEKPDLWVFLRVRTKNDKVITTWGGGGWGWGWWGGGWMHSRVEDAPVGTLVVDLVDAKTRELVWRGMASRDIDAGETQQDRAHVTQEAVDKLFADFPPKKV
jgi:hypothetical protein